MMVRAFRNADCPGRVRFPGRTKWIGIQCCVYHPLDQEDDGKLSAGGSEEVEALSFLGKYSDVKDEETCGLVTRKTARQEVATLRVASYNGERKAGTYCVACAACIESCIRRSLEV